MVIRGCNNSFIASTEEKAQTRGFPNTQRIAVVAETGWGTVGIISRGVDGMVYRNKAWLWIEDLTKHSLCRRRL